MGILRGIQRAHWNLGMKEKTEVFQKTQLSVIEAESPSPFLQLHKKLP